MIMISRQCLLVQCLAQRTSFIRIISTDKIIENRKLIHSKRGYCKKPNSRNNYFITTPIFYVNAQPHIGHLYSALLADASFRFQQLRGVPEDASLFSTGTDEHGQKIQQAAAAEGYELLEFCDRVSGKFKSLFHSANISYTHYIRTTEEQHKQVVQQVFRTLVERGHIYQGNYKGWYCVSDEAFLTDSQLEEVTLASGEKRLVSAESGHPVEWHSEDNYMFKLSKFQDDLLYWLKDERRVQPKRFHRQLLRWLSEGLQDLSVSRPKDRISWGVEVPGDAQHTVYVWVDALINYLTVAGYPNLHMWPPDIQVLGKDILRFHGIYWPALLLGTGLEPPRSLLCHSHWTVEGEKMSKSLGNVVCPHDRMESYSPDGLRYLLLRGGTPHSDSTWSDNKGAQMLNAELADTLGNLLNRCMAPSLNPDQQAPPLDPGFLQTSPAGQSLVGLLLELPDTVAEHYNNFNFYHGIEVIMAAVREANVFVQEEKPWELKKLPDRTRLDSVLRVAFEALRVASVALQPIVPAVSSQALDSLGVAAQHRVWASLRDGFGDPHSAYLSTPYPLGSRKKLFTKIKIN